MVLIACLKSIGLDKQIFKRKIVIVSLAFNLYSAFWCAKEPSH